MAQVYEDGAHQGEWSFREAVAKGIAGTIGILTALIVDYIQKGNDSALLYGTRIINEAALARFSMQAVPPYIYLVALVVAGFALVYIFEPTNKRNAFYAGAGVLGFLATFAPISQQTLEVQAAGALPSLESILGGEPAAPVMPNAPSAGEQSMFFEFDGLPVIPAVYRPYPENSQIVDVQAIGIPVNIVIQFPSSQGNSMPQIRAWLHDSLSNRTLTLGAGAKLAQTSSGPVIVYQTVIGTMQSGDTLADLAVRVEAQGYAITTIEATVTKNTPQPVRIDVDMVPSSTPLALQRLQYPYRW